MVCRVDPYQEDAVVVKVAEDTSIADPTAKRVDLANDLKLEISHLPFNDANKLDITNLIATPTAVTDTAGGTLGVLELTYSGKYKNISNTFEQPVSIALAANAPVALGDYMELKVVDTSSIGGTSTIFSKYA